MVGPVAMTGPSIRRSTGLTLAPFERLLLFSCVFCGLLEKFRIYSRVDLDTLVLEYACFFAVLLVFSQQGKGEATHILPPVHDGLSLRRTTRAKGLISLFENVSIRWIDEPSDRRARSVYVNNTGFNVAHFFGSSRGEEDVRILPVCCDEN